MRDPASADEVGLPDVRIFDRLVAGHEVQIVMIDLEHELLLSLYGPPDRYMEKRLIARRAVLRKDHGNGNIAGIVRAAALVGETLYPFAFEENPAEVRKVHDLGHMDCLEEAPPEPVGAFVIEERPGWLDQSDLCARFRDSCGGLEKEER